jgi:hypothetical protein
MKLDLVQPRHNAALDSSEEKGHIYMPTALWSVAARILAVKPDAEIALHDENIRSAHIDSGIVGINLLGAPYIPEAIELQKRFRQETRTDLLFLLGGKVMDGLSPEQRLKLFGKRHLNGNSPEAFRQIGIPELPTEYDVSLIPVYEKISDADMREYLTGEFSFFIAQGCQKACEFCAADRTRKDIFTGKVTKVKEKYRDPDESKKDLEYLVQKARQLKIEKLSIYLSNLDLFQTPEKLAEFARRVKAVLEKNPGFSLKMRGLSTVESFNNCRKRSPEIIEEMVDVGLDTVGFGIDGMSEEVWKKVKKGHNTESGCIDAIHFSKVKFGITPEILMVFGHEEADTPETLARAVEFTKTMIERYGAVPRPHVAKSFIPGNDGWNDPKNKGRIEMLLEHPELFQSLDFTALPSRLTHPNDLLREVSTRKFIEICELAGNTTKWLKPIEVGMSDQQKKEVRVFNRGRYDR